MKDSYNSDIKIACQTILDNTSSNKFEYFNNKNEIIVDSGVSLIKQLNINDNCGIGNSVYRDNEFTLDGASIITKEDNSKNNNNNETTINWDNEIKIGDEISSRKLNSNIIQSIDSIRTKSLRILITGCTGYVGVQVFVQLLRIINCETVYCLVRNVKSTSRAYEKINNQLKQQQLYNQISEREFQKVIPVIGDLDKDKFGLSEIEYQHLSKSVHLIINIASNNNINSTYDQCKLTNVNGIKELIKLSTSISLKRIVHISPSFLSFNQNLNQDIHQLPIFSNEQNDYNGYLNSKSVSEHLIYQYSNEFNVPNMIIRSPFIISNPSGLISSIIKCCLNTGYYPIDAQFKTNVVPIQWLSESIITTIFNDNNWIYNNNNNNNQYQQPQLQKNNNNNNSNKLNIYNIVGEPITLNEIFSILSNEYQILPIQFNDWILKLKSTTTYINNNNILNNIQFIKSYPNNYKQSTHNNNNNNNKQYINPKITKDIIKQINK